LDCCEYKLLVTKSDKNSMIFFVNMIIFIVGEDKAFDIQ